MKKFDIGDYYLVVGNGIKFDGFGHWKIPINIWVHYVITFNGSIWKIYFDGYLEFSTVLTTPVLNDENILFGKS